jgi:seryl-tRNA synthetase
MAGRLPPSLNWLIDKRARLDGEIKKMQAAADYAKELIKELSSIKEDLAAIDRAMKLHIIQVEVENIPSIRSQETRIKLPHGELTRLLITRLRQANGAVLTTSELTTFVAECFSVARFEEKDHKQLYQCVRYRLKNLVSDGVVQRHRRPKKNSEAQWSLACSTTVFLEVHHTP